MHLLAISVWGAAAAVFDLGGQRWGSSRLARAMHRKRNIGTAPPLGPGPTSITGKIVRSPAWQRRRWISPHRSTASASSTSAAAAAPPFWSWRRGSERPAMYWEPTSRRNRWPEGAKASPPPGCGAEVICADVRAIGSRRTVSISSSRGSASCSSTTRPRLCKCASGDSAGGTIGSRRVPPGKREPVAHSAV